MTAYSCSLGALFIAYSVGTLYVFLHALMDPSDLPPTDYMEASHCHWYTQRVFSLEYLLPAVNCAQVWYYCSCAPRDGRVIRAVVSFFMMR
jgi:hypothetical protein